MNNCVEIEKMNFTFPEFAVSGLLRFVFRGNIMRAVTSLIIALVSLHLSASAVTADEVVKTICEAGKWSGASITVKDGERIVVNDNVDLPKTSYFIDPSQDVATVLTSGKSMEARVLHRYFGHLAYTIVSYVYGGVNYTDTIYENGFVIIQYSKMSLLGQPYASTVSNQCSVSN